MSIYSYQIKSGTVTTGGITMTFDVLKDSAVVETKIMMFSPNKSKDFIQRQIQNYVLDKRNTDVVTAWTSEDTGEHTVISE